MRAQSKLTSKGRVTIPLAIRHALRLEEGDTVIFELMGGDVRLRPHHAGTVRAFAGASRLGPGKTVAEIVDEIRGLRDG